MGERPLEFILRSITWMLPIEEILFLPNSSTYDTNWFCGATYGDEQPNGLYQALIRCSTE